MRDVTNENIIKFIYGKKSKNIRGKFKANQENSRKNIEVLIKWKLKKSRKKKKIKQEII